MMTTPLHRAPSPAGRPDCRFCGAPLDPHQAARGAVCGAPACERQRVQEASRAAFQRDWDSFVAHQRDAIPKAGSLIAHALRRLDARPGEAAIGVLPRYDRPMVALPEDRLAAFEARLDEIIAAAFAEPLPEIDLARREREEAGEQPLVAAACSTCQGFCCSLGGRRHAFLDVVDIQLFRLRHPDADAAAVRAHYLGGLPDRSIEHSCVYHVETGCALARTDRAAVCNRYHCNQLTQLLTRMRGMKTEKAVIIAHESEAAPAVSIFGPGGIETLCGAAPAGVEPGPAETAAAAQAALQQLPQPLPEARPFVIPAELVDGDAALSGLSGSRPPDD